MVSRGTPASWEKPGPSRTNTSMRAAPPFSLLDDGVARPSVNGVGSGQYNRAALVLHQSASQGQGWLDASSLQLVDDEFGDRPQGLEDALAGHRDRLKARGLDRVQVAVEHGRGQGIRQVGLVVLHH